MPALLTRGQHPRVPEGVLPQPRPLSVLAQGGARSENAFLGSSLETSSEPGRIILSDGSFSFVEVRRNFGNSCWLEPRLGSQVRGQVTQS